MPGVYSSGNSRSKDADSIPQSVTPVLCRLSLLADLECCGILTQVRAVETVTIDYSVLRDPVPGRLVPNLLGLWLRGCPPASPRITH